MGEVLRVAVIDDDQWKRHAMAELLDADPHVQVVYSLDQDTAAAWPRNRWEDITTAVVDVHDDRAPGEVGTDLYSGISAIQRLTDQPVDVIAVMPYDPHPLVDLRLFHAAPSRVYKRWELQTVGDIVQVMLEPAPGREARCPPKVELVDLGAQRSRPNDAVAMYLASPIAGEILPGIGIKNLSIGRGSIRRFREQIAHTGFTGTESLSWSHTTDRVPRWPDVRDYLLRLLGRLDAPPSDHDKPWLLS